MLVKRASLTVESAIMIPIFLMAVICIASITGVYAQTLEKMTVLRDRSERAAVYSSVVDGEFWIDLTQPQEFRPMFVPPSVGTVSVYCRGRARAWTGRDPESAAYQNSGQAAEYVYLTENASVYHTSSHCTHLELSTYAVSGDAVSFRRNEYGASYRPCEKCAANGVPADVVYITNEGDCYHNDAGCSGLKRTVRMVTAEEAEGMRECTRCTAQNQ